jgi:uncharacterized protein (DUF302 family)
MAGYGISIKLDGTLEEVKGRLVEALKTQGFGVLTEIDVQKTMKARLGVEYKPYLILGACNPQFAHQALAVDESIGLLLPCNVVLRQDADGVAVIIQDPEVMFSVLDDATKQSMAGFPQQVKNSLQSVLDSLKN